MSENLFAYTATNSGYSQGTAGAINGERVLPLLRLCLL